MHTGNNNNERFQSLRPNKKERIRRMEACLNSIPARPNLLKLSKLMGLDYETMYRYIERHKLIFTPATPFMWKVTSNKKIDFRAGK